VQANHPDCAKARATIQLAINELTAVLNLKRTIRLTVQFSHFCPTPHSSDGTAPTDCEDRDILGQGGAMTYWSWQQRYQPDIPNSSLLFASSRSKKIKYLYPQGLMKQLVENDSTMGWSTYDIFLRMNADRNGRVQPGTPKYFFKVSVINPVVSPLPWCVDKCGFRATAAPFNLVNTTLNTLLHTKSFTVWGFFPAGYSTLYLCSQNAH
jgi:hypothetical protein